MLTTFTAHSKGQTRPKGVVLLLNDRRQHSLNLHIRFNNGTHLWPHSLINNPKNLENPEKSKNRERHQPTHSRTHLRKLATPTTRRKSASHSLRTEQVIHLRHIRPKKTVHHSLQNQQSSTSRKTRFQPVAPKHPS